MAPLPTVRAHCLEDQHANGWLIDQLWARTGVGIIGGAPKCCKSWLGLDLAVSVASNSRCLDRFDVHRSGTVIIYLAEDANHIVRSRLEGIARHRRLRLENLAIEAVQVPSLRLDTAQDQTRLRETIEEKKPVLLLLDPFVRLHRSNENDVGEVSAILAHLRELQRACDTAVVVVHHARKNGTQGAPGQALRGSGDFHAWGDSNLYLKRHRDRLILTVEHRAAPAPEPFLLALAGDEDATHLALAPEPASEAIDDPVDLKILNALRRAGRPTSRSELRGLLRLRNQTLGDALRRLEQQHRIDLTDGGYSVVPDSHS